MAVGIGAGVAAVLRLPLSAIVLALLLTSQSGAGAAPLVIVGVITAYLVSLALERERDPAADVRPAAVAGVDGQRAAQGRDALDHVR